MAETISLEVRARVPLNILERIYRKVTPDYITTLLAQQGMPTDDFTIETVVSSYEQGFPTQDLALRAMETKKGMRFWGIASGEWCRPERAAVKYLILEYIQNELTKVGITSELNIADLNRE